MSSLENYEAQLAFAFDGEKGRTGAAERKPFGDGCTMAHLGMRLATQLNVV